VNVQLNHLTATRKSLVVALDAAEVDSELAGVVREISQLARIPGFRPGKAPAAMVLKRFGKEVAAELKQKVVSKAYEAAQEQQKLQVVNVVKVEEGEIKAGAAASITLTLDVQPEFTLPAYTDLPTEVAPTDVADAEVTRVIEGLRSERADFKAAARPAAKGDYVKLSYAGTIDGQPITELAGDKQLYAQAPQTWEEVEGEHDGVIPGLGRQLAGLEVGGKRSVTVTFPADFSPVPALAGKAVAYAVEIQEVRERVLPALDEAFFKAQQVDDLAGLQAKVSQKLQKDYENRQAQRRQITEKLAAAVDFQVPESLVDTETQGLLRQFIEENMRRGVAAEQFEKDKKELFQGARQAATNRVKLQFILGRVAEQEKLEVTNEDLNNFIYREAMRTQQKPDKLAQALGADRAQLRSVQQSIIFDKAVDFVVSKAKVTVAAPAP
jgi:trigger factor